jgi:hypothetical protein
VGEGRLPGHRGPVRRRVQRRARGDMAERFAGHVRRSGATVHHRVPGNAWSPWIRRRAEWWPCRGAEGSEGSVVPVIARGRARIVVHLDATAGTARIQGGPEIPQATAELLACDAEAQVLLREGRARQHADFLDGTFRFHAGGDDHRAYARSAGSRRTPWCRSRACISLPDHRNARDDLAAATVCRCPVRDLRPLRSRAGSTARMTIMP